MRRLSFLALIVIVVLMACSPSPPDTHQSPTISPLKLSQIPFSPATNDWPHSISDLPPDPRVKFGRLENGFRYAILPVEDKNGTVALQLHVSAGFKDEDESTYGIAHLLEHMAFRGAEGNTEKSIIHDLQIQGAGFGFDLNGFTTFDETIYQLNLTSAKSGNIRAALKNFSQLVTAPNLSAENLNLEKKVILAELKSRDTPQARARLDKDKFKYPDQKRYEIAGIGNFESLSTITLQDVKAFYTRYYRPDNTFLAIAGGVDLLKTEKAVTTLFANWPKGSERPVDRAQSVDLNSFPSVKHYAEKDTRTGLYYIENSAPTLPNDTLKIRQDKFAEKLANAMIKNRLKPRIDAEKNVSWINLSKTRTKTYDIQQVIFGASDYVIAAKFFEEERLRAIKYGFQNQEITFALKSERINLKNQAKNSDFISAWSEASRLRNSFNNGYVYVSREQKLSNFITFSERLKAEDYHQAVKDMWGDFKPRYRTQSNKSMADTLEKIHTNLAELSESEITPPVDLSPNILDEIDLGVTGSVTTRDIYSRDKIHRLLFANGARLNYHRREEEDDNIEIAVTLTGDFREFSNRYSSVQEQALAFSRADIAGITKSELDRQFVGQKTDFSVALSNKSLVISTSTIAKDLEASLNLITAFILNVDIKSKSRTEIFNDYISNIKTASNNSPIIAGALKIPFRYSDKSDAFLSKTSGLYTSEDKTLKSIEKIITSGTIEVGVVGDFDTKSLEDIFASTIGSLPARIDNKDNPEIEVDKITHLKPGVTTLYYQGSAEQMAVFYCWPISPEQNAKMDAIANLSEKVVINRMLERFREQLGLTYSPQFILHYNPAFPNFKYGCFSLQISPDDEQLVHENFKTIIEEFVSVPVTQTELIRAREPVLSLLERYSDTNKALVSPTAFAYSDPSLLKRHKSKIPRLEKVRLKAINTFMKEVFKISDAHIFRIQKSEPHMVVKHKTLELGALIGNAEAQYDLGNLLQRRAEYGDQARAYKLFEQAASHGHKDAHYELGRYYTFEQKNLKIAARHLKLSEDPKEGVFLLADIYFKNPDIFPEVSDMDIMDLYRRSSENGYSYAQQALAQRYKDGSMTKRDLVKGYKWALIYKSSKNGVTKETDIPYFRSYKDGLSQEDQDRAIKLADEWIKNFNNEKSKQ